MSYEPSSEQIEAIAEVLYGSSNFQWRFATSDARAWCVEEKAMPLAQSPAFQAIIRSAQAAAVRSLADPDALQLRDGVGSPWMVAEWMNAEADRIEANHPLKEPTA